jgi:hypothetical protein
MNRNSLRGASRMAAVLAAGILAVGITNVAFGQVVLPTGATITPVQLRAQTLSL